MKETFDKLQAQGRIGPMENVGTQQRPILQMRPDYRAEYPKLVVVGKGANGKPLKKLVNNAHEELALKATSAPTISQDEYKRLEEQQELASLRAKLAAMEHQANNEKMKADAQEASKPVEPTALTHPIETKKPEPMAVPSEPIKEGVNPKVVSLDALSGEKKN
jgi:PHD/YefM family antitoxin component YafN of YafNO toxin-antitoxin module